MIQLSEELELALEADDRARLEQVIEAAEPDDYRTLRELVRDPGTPEMHRRRALYAIGKWPDRDEDAVTEIAAVLPDLGELERITAISTLGRIGSPEAKEVLLEYRDDDAPDVRRQVASSLARYPDDRTIEALHLMAEDDESEAVRAKAERVIERLDRE